MPPNLIESPWAPLTRQIVKRATFHATQWRGRSVMLRNQLRSVEANFKRKLAYYRAVAAHDRTPRLSKLLLGAAVGYALLPFDLIPDFLPVVGHLDDAIIIPGLVVLAIRLVPKDILEECRQVSNRGAA